ncbi:hypothetical protein LTR78_009334 [Recurvomyces mirabilis]|uniref:HNH nuclease domain-containing protein n=1 Tax=Recurvomyces mirabilis TaxID=574656 RepID=A0AAE0WHF3_9PEZI|nr:hypothetical protein LTR78_009334 [Recurvomyces mirabilis]
MSQRVCIRHPGYNAPNTLFTLPASDGLDRDRAHYATVQAVSSIITNGAANAWLSKSSLANDDAVTPDLDGLIASGVYFLHVSQDDWSNKEPYPLVPNFRAWRFPHGALPPLWYQAARNDRRPSRTSEPVSSFVAGESCRITKKFLACDHAHIVPASEKLWFTSNEMGQYGQLSGRTGEAAADTSANMMRLRIDAHRLWDSHHFSIIAREDKAAADAVWFTQMIYEGEELYQDWHLRKLQPLAGRSPEYLYARFAWNIFPQLQEFLQAGQQRWLTVRGLNGRTETRAYNPTECREFTVGQGRGRSASPTKRARSETSGNNDLGASDDLDEHESLRKLYDADATPTTPSFDSAIADMHDECRCKRGSSCGYDDTFAPPPPKPFQDQEWPRYLCGDYSDPEQDRGRKRQRV